MAVKDDTIIVYEWHCGLEQIAHHEDERVARLAKEANDEIARLCRVEAAAVELAREPFGRLAPRAFFALREALGDLSCEVCGLDYRAGQHYGSGRSALAGQIRARHEYRPRGNAKAAED